MADIFVSYSSSDRSRVEPYIQAFESQGWSVWWDREILPGKSWDDTIEAEVADARCVVVFWTERSIESRWVKIEALVGVEGGKLVPVLLDDVTVPIAFKTTQVADATISDATAALNIVVGAVADLLAHTPIPVVPTKSPVLTRKVIAAAAALLLVPVLGWLILQSGPSDEGNVEQELVDLSSPVPGFAGNPAIAVMPFTNRSSTAQGPLLAQGLSNDIANGLARFRGFPVISATATQVYQGTTPDIRKVAKDVGAGYIVTGDLRTSEGDVRVNAQLLDAAGRTVWSDQFDGDFDNFLSVQDQITEEIIGTIWPQYMNAEHERATRGHPANLTAWLEFVQGWEYMFDSSRLKDGETHCRRAIELAPTFAFAHTCVGHAMGMQLIGSTEPDDVVIARLEEAFGYFETARNLDPFDATACGCMVYWLTIMGRLDEAEAEAEYGLSINPSNHVMTRAYGLYLLARGRNEEALEFMKRALRLNPQGGDTVDTYANLATAMLVNGDIDQGVRYARQAVVQDPTNPAYHTQLVVALFLNRNEPEARRSLEKARRRIPQLRADTIWNRGWLKPLTTQIQARMASGTEAEADRADTGATLRELFARLG